MSVMARSRSTGGGLTFVGVGVPRILLHRSVCIPRRLCVRGSASSAGEQPRKGKKKEAGVYKDTVNLPSTNFDQRANAVRVTV